MSTSQTTEIRHLYVPSGVVSWSAQMDRAHKLALDGLAVSVHRHGRGGMCIEKSATTPNEWCARIELTPDGEATNVVPCAERDDTGDLESNT